MILGFRLDFTLHTNINPHLASPVGEGQVTLTMSSASQISPLSFSPVGERLVTLVLPKTDGDRFLRFCQRQSPVFPFCKFTFFLATIEKNYVT